MKKLLTIVLAAFVFACNASSEEEEDIRLVPGDYTTNDKIIGIRALWSQATGDSISLKAKEWKNQVAPYDSIYFYKVIWDSLDANGNEVMETVCGQQVVIQVIKWVRLEDPRFIRETGKEYQK